MLDVKNLTAIQVGLASPDKIRQWSNGEVKKPETINYRSQKPEMDGLFCERIFGPAKDYECHCGKYKKIRFQGITCEKCHVEVTTKAVRRERMGHIELCSPCAHIWYLKGIPSRMGLVLKIPPKQLEEVIYFVSRICLNPGTSSVLKYREVIDERTARIEFVSAIKEIQKSLDPESFDYQRAEELIARMENPQETFNFTSTANFISKFTGAEFGSGAEAIKRLLSEVDLDKEYENIVEDIKNSSGQERQQAYKRLECIEAFRNSNNRPEWMILDALPVIPPDLRPMLQLDGGRFATSDLNDLYRRVITRNARLKREIDMNAPDVILMNEKRMLQEAVDALIDNGRRTKPVTGPGGRALKSLSSFLKGKQGRFRQNLLGKRVDYSGRSVIAVGPFLKMYQCGIPREMAVQLFRPFIAAIMIKEGIATSHKQANKMIDHYDERVWDIVERVVKEHPVLLNRAPTLHRLGIQAFEPVLIEGKAIRLHPLVCTPFNADFDGDQMAVHVPLSLEAQAEARLLMLASNNILNPKDGKPVVTPSQDMILGNYYLTLERKGEANEGHIYKDFDEAYMAYKHGDITLHTRIFVDISYLPENKFNYNVIPSKYLFTTMGKMIFNSILPDEFPYLNEPTEDNLCVETPVKYFLNLKDAKNSYDELIARDEVAPFKKKQIARIIAEVFKRFQITETSKMLDRIKDLGFKYSTIAGLTISVADVLDYKGKDERIAKADQKIDQITMMYELGQLTNKERKKLVEKEWGDARNEIQEGLWSELSKQKDNHIFMMADSGSRGNSSNFAQLAGMRGLMANTAGETIEVPVRANFREGLTVSEFFISTHGSRKGSTDTALKTAESGYLTRRLVDVSQDVIISTVDCGTEKGMYVEDIIDDGGKVIVTVGDRVIGRYAAKDLVHPETGEVIVYRNEMFTEEHAKVIDNAKIKRVSIRTNITCDCKSGVCMLCYGRNLATNKVVEVGEAVGVVAAQSIGEPGTQLTMRTFHTGGVASAADITQGLPRVQELFEARKPKGKATISEIDGVIDSIEKTKSGLAVTIINDDEEKIYTIDATSELLIQVGSHVKRGDKLMKGSIHPKELLRIKDAEAVQKYIVEEVQKVYRAQSVEISDKHIEIIVRQMMRKVQVVQEGDTELLPGKDVSVIEYKDAVQKVIANGGNLPTAKPLLLGITKAALACQSFLSACSFQETTRILTQAAIQSKVDNLVGLKENVIIGGLIPAGTGVLVEDEFECQQKPENIYQDVLEAANEAHEAELDDEDLEDEVFEEEDELMDDEDPIYTEDYLE